MVGRPPHQADIDAVAADVRASPAADIERARRALLDSAPLGELDADPIGTAAALAFGALRESPGGPVDCRGRRGPVVLHPRTKPVRHQPYSTHSMSVRSTSERSAHPSVRAFESERRRVSLEGGADVLCGT
ncbi:hypothetical protein ACIQWZ_39360 [Streptomyces sp. NPDC098077]|uniref:hypothetical protein n=1 Tax=Streptomyces sp. NPDC098077 TaxID=3366093 RepID=UPI00382286BE